MTDSRGPGRAKYVGEAERPAPLRPTQHKARLHLSQRAGLSTELLPEGYDMYDEYSENVAVEAPDKRIDLMSQFVDIDNEIGRLERELTERDKQLSAMRQEREGLRRKLDDVINGDQPVKAEGRFA